MARKPAACATGAHPREPSALPVDYSETAGPKAPKAMVGRTRGRAAPRPAAGIDGSCASCGRAATPLPHCKEERVARDWAGEAVRTAADPARADLDGWDTACGVRAAGVPGCGSPNACLPAHGVSRGGAACRKHSWASRPEDTVILGKTFWGGGGSHRRSRATER